MQLIKQISRKDEIKVGRGQIGKTIAALEELVFFKIPQFFDLPVVKFFNSPPTY